MDADFLVDKASGALGHDKSGTYRCTTQYPIVSNFNDAFLNVSTCYKRQMECSEW